MSSPEISVLIVSTNIRDELRGCLRSLRRAACEAEFEVIVVDNASTDGSADLVESEFPEVRLHRASCNLGFAAAMNVGLGMARGDFVFALNPDTLLPRTTVAKLHNFLKDNPRAAIVGVQLTSPEGLPQPSTFTDPTLPKEFLNLLPEIKRILRPREVLRVLAPVPKNGDSAPPRRVQCVSGGAFLARTGMLRDVGGFDEAFFVYHEDIDICRRLRNAGWEVWSLPSAQVIHFDARTTGYSPFRFPRMPVLEWRLKGMDHYWRKHRTPGAHGAWRLLARSSLSLRITISYLGLIVPVGGRKSRLDRIGEFRNIKGMLGGIEQRMGR